MTTDTRYAMTLQIDCPACRDGTWSIDVDRDGREIGSKPEIDCENTAACARAYADGRYGDALAAAFDRECDRLHGRGLQDIGGADDSGRLRDAGRVR